MTLQDMEDAIKALAHWQNVNGDLMARLAQELTASQETFAVLQRDQMALQRNLIESLDQVLDWLQKLEKRVDALAKPRAR